MQLPIPLDSLSAEEQQILTRHLQPVRFAAGECVFRAGSLGDGCYLIGDGEIRLELEGQHVDDEAVLGYLKPGSLLGELALLDGLARSASAYAETDVAAHRLSSAAIDQLCRDAPQIGISILRTLGRDVSLKLRQTTQRMAEFIMANAPDPEVNAMVARAAEAQRQFEAWPEDRVDALLLAVANAVMAQAEPLARATVEETRIGNVPDKTSKNMHASLGIYHYLAGKPGRGVIAVDAQRRVTDIASPAGVVFGIIPVTNPVATAVFKTLISLKARCALILSFHRACLGVGNMAGEIMQRALAEQGAPAHILQWVRERSSRTKTAKFMSHPGVSLILATGGAGMVTAAYSSGTPALGVGPGNVPCYVAADADIDSAAQAITWSKPYDNGLICGAESNLVVDARVHDEFVAALGRHGAAVLSPAEAERFSAAAFDPGGHGFNKMSTGQSAQVIADVIGIKRNYPIKVIVVPTAVEAVDTGSPLAGEKLAPLLSLFTVPTDEAAFALCGRILAASGAGHTAIIHTRSSERADRFRADDDREPHTCEFAGCPGHLGRDHGSRPLVHLGLRDVRWKFHH